MKKKILFTLLTLVAIGCFALLITRQVSASAGNSGEGSWFLPETNHAYSTINLDLESQSAPDWLQQLSGGIIINQAEKICYPFRGGQFHWVPQILQLRDGKWLKVATDKEYLAGAEGSLFACASTNSAGTFALFGYYDGPAEHFEVVPTEEPPLECPPGFTPVGNQCQPLPKK